MTLCIAAICGHGQNIVMVADQKVTDQAVGEELLKIRFVHPRWTVMYAGALDFVTRFLSRVELDRGKGYAATEVGSLLGGIYDDLMKESGIKKDFSQHLQIILTGFDLQGPHILSWREPGRGVFQDEVGFEVTGLGDYYARGMIYFQRWNKRESLAVTIYRLCVAKFFTERILDIGEKTSLLIMDSHSKGERREIIDIGEIRKEWKAHGEPHDPPGIENTVGEILANKYLTHPSFF